MLTTTSDMSQIPNINCPLNCPPDVLGGDLGDALVPAKDVGEADQPRGILQHHDAAPHPRLERLAPEVLGRVEELGVEAEGVVEHGGEGLGGGGGVVAVAVGRRGHPRETQNSVLFFPSEFV